MMFVILPQVPKAVIPVNIGQFISLFKDTMPVALVSITNRFGMAGSPWTIQTRWELAARSASSLAPCSGSDHETQNHTV